MLVMMMMTTTYDFANNFDWIIGWGRVALLIDYNANNESIRLRIDVEHNE